MIVATTENGTPASRFEHPSTSSMSQIVEPTGNRRSNLGRFPCFLPSANWLRRIAIVYNCCSVPRSAIAFRREYEMTGLT
jgi:hypothetical protein